MTEPIIAGKFCKRCNVFRPISECYVWQDVLRCKECVKKNNKRYGKLKRTGRKFVSKSPKDLTLHSAYQIRERDWKEMFDRQHGKCAVCRTASVNLYVDHNHVTGKVRGLLCHRCNTGLGFLKDDIRILQSALAYLVKYDS